VAIGGAQTGVYPRESPGGWNIIGTTDPERLIPLEPGDRLVFEKL
jgi:allophanate hydrolase subunit 1